MKTELSSLDLHYLVTELDILIGGKINKIYQREEEFLFEFHIPNAGKKFLKILPKTLFITDEKTDYEEAKTFCMVLRKYLNNFRLREIKQLGFERILEMTFENEKKAKLIIELFSQGNIILCDENYKIINAFLFHKWKDREVKKGVDYVYPKREHNFLALTKEELAKTIKSSLKENIVKTFALDLGLGGLYSEELCVLANIDKNKKALSDKEIDEVYKASKELKSKKINAVLYDNNEISPFLLEQFKSTGYKKYASFNEALSANLGSLLILERKRNNKFTQELEKINRIIEEQEKTLVKYHQSIEENQKKGEFIYEKYPLVTSLLNELAEIRKKYSWKEIREKLKDHRLVKEINEKEGKIVIDLT